MSKYVCIGDLHCREVWKDIVKKESDADKIIFLGDYTVPRDLSWYYRDPTDACDFLYDVLDYKDQNLDKVILLRGNHDLWSCGYYWARCYPQDHPKVTAYWQTDDVKNWFLNNTQWIYRIPNTNIICSHAGISKVWFDNITKSKQWKDLLNNPNSGIYEKDILDCINLIEPCELFGFINDNPFDTNGESKCQPCTWIRPSTLIEYILNNTIQVVGHTLVAKEIFKWDNKENNSTIWCCDALGLKESEYLVIEDGKFRVHKVV